MRCYICDFCQEIDLGQRGFRWLEQENGFICSECEAEIGEALNEFADDLGESEVLEYPDFREDSGTY